MQEEITKIIRQVSSITGVDTKDIISKRRGEQHITDARAVAMYRIYNETRCSYSMIGEIMSNRDHSGVMHAIRKVDQALSISRAAVADEVSKNDLSRALSNIVFSEFPNYEKMSREDYLEAMIDYSNLMKQGAEILSKVNSN